MEGAGCGGPFIVQADGLSLYYSGDTGYSRHFREIPDLFGAPDYALVGIGAYKPRWFMQPNHISPYDALTASTDMKAALTDSDALRNFRICSDEPLHDPPLVFAAEAKKRKIDVYIPVLGEVVKLKQDITLGISYLPNRASVVNK